MAVLLGPTIFECVPSNPIVTNSNTVGAIDKIKFGIGSAYRLRAGVYKGLLEGVNGVDNPVPANNNNIGLVTGTTPFVLTKFGSPLTNIIAPTQAWENGEICVDTVIYRPATTRLYAYTHGGNNAGPRQLGVYTAAGVDASWSTPGAWTYNSIVLSPGASGAWDDGGLADVWVTRITATSWSMIYRGWTVAGGPATSQLGLATSTDGLTWTKYAGNPVFAPIGTGFESTGIFGGRVWIDSLGRWHMLYDGDDGASFGTGTGVGYAYSDTNGQTWTRPGTTALWSKTDSVGVEVDVVHMIEEPEWLVVTKGTYNTSVTRIDGRVVGWIPKPSTLASPVQPGRIGTVAGDRVNFPAASTVFAQTTFSAVLDFKAPPGNTYRILWIEEAAFDNHVIFAINATGLAEFRYRGATGTLIQLAGAVRVDDGLHHYMGFRRISAASWEFVIDGVVVITSVLAPTGETGTPVCAVGGTDPAQADAPSPAKACVRRFVSKAGYAMTVPEMNTIWNGGAVDGVPPVTGTTKMDLKIGNTVSETANSATVSGMVLVDQTPLADMYTVGSGSPLAAFFGIPFQLPATSARAY